MGETAHIAIVTGAARGIGKAIALRFASAGINVLCTARSAVPGDGLFPGSLEETVSQIHSMGGSAVGAPADLVDPAFDARSLFELAQSAFGGEVDILVNNAALMRDFDLTFEKMDQEHFRQTVDVNVWAPWALAVHALAGMRRRGAGWILNISSRGAAPKVGPPYDNGPLFGQCLYGASKAMLDRLTTGAASELWASNIAVNALAPERAVATENSIAVANVSTDWAEPAETMAEAALALCTGDPQALTGNVAYSLSLLVALGRPVYSLDGRSLVPGWQPQEISPEKLLPPYLQGANKLGRVELTTTHTAS